jgi:hypothetical protein
MAGLLPRGRFVVAPGLLFQKRLEREIILQNGRRATC